MLERISSKIPGAPVRRLDHDAPVNASQSSQFAGGASIGARHRVGVQSMARRYLLCAQDLYGVCVGRLHSL